MLLPPAAVLPGSPVVIIDRRIAGDAASGRPFQPGAAATAFFCLVILNLETAESVTDT